MIFSCIRQFLLDILFPKRCASCGREGEYICRECLSKVSFLKNQVCPSCKKFSSFGQYCSSFCDGNFAFDQLIVCCHYEKKSLIRNLVVLLKYKFSREVCSVLGEVLKTQFVYFSQYFEFFQAATIVPVPIHKKRLKYRGFNQAALLAEYLLFALKNDPNHGRQFKGLAYSDCLKRTCRAGQQAKLNREERLRNLKNSIEIREGFSGDLKGRNVVLIDDVATTCSTLNECSRILKKCGAKYVCGLVLARG